VPRHPPRDLADRIAVRVLRIDPVQAVHVHVDEARDDVMAVEIQMLVGGIRSSRPW
jgi:hypothetical protein